MKAVEAGQLTKSYVDKNQIIAGYKLDDIYKRIKESCRVHLSYTEYFLPWSSNTDPEDRKSIVRHILTELKGNGYKVLLGGLKGKYTILKIYW